LSKNWQIVRKSCKKVEKKLVKISEMEFFLSNKLSKSCQNYQKVGKKLGKSWQKAVKKMSKVGKKLAKSWQKVSKL
jgi:hypothetical protein